MRSRYIGKKEALAMLIIMGAEKKVMQMPGVSAKEYLEARELAIDTIEKSIPLMHEELRTTKSRIRKKILIRQIEQQQESLKELTS